MELKSIVSNFIHVCDGLTDDDFKSLYKYYLDLNELAKYLPVEFSLFKIEFSYFAK